MPSEHLSLANALSWVIIQDLQPHQFSNTFLLISDVLNLIRVLRHPIRGYLLILLLV